MACCGITCRLTGPKSSWCSGHMWCHAIDKVPDPWKQKYYCSDVCPKLQKLHSFVALLKLYIYTAKLCYNKMLRAAKTILLYCTYSQTDRFKNVQRKHISHIWKYSAIKESLGETNFINLQLKSGSITCSRLFHEEKRTAFSFFNQKSLIVNECSSSF
jgi:hypothetical protein